MKKIKHWKQHAEVLAMQLLKWLLETGTMGSSLTFGAVAWSCMPCSVVTFPLRTKKLPICTRKSWMQNTNCPNSFQPMRRISYQRFSWQIQTNASILTDSSNTPGISSTSLRTKTMGTILRLGLWMTNWWWKWKPLWASASTAFSAQLKTTSTITCPQLTTCSSKSMHRWATRAIRLLAARQCRPALTLAIVIIRLQSAVTTIKLLCKTHPTLIPRIDKAKWVMKTRLAHLAKVPLHQAQHPLPTTNITSSAASPRMTGSKPLFKTNWSSKTTGENSQLTLPPVAIIAIMNGAVLRMKEELKATVGLLLPQMSMK